MHITCNYHPRPIVSRDEVPADVLAQEFDWTDPKDPGAFFCYRGTWYAISEFLVAPDSLPGWDGIHGLNAFCGVVVRITEPGESVICGRLHGA